jgi:hypothetical protein
MKALRYRGIASDYNAPTDSKGCVGFLRLRTPRETRHTPK